MRSHLSFLAAGLVTALVACGGSTADTTDSGGGGGDDGSTSSNDATIMDTSTGNDGTMPNPDVNPPPADGGGMGTIQCGMNMCNAATQVCCVTGMGMTAMEACVAIGACTGVSIPCTGPSNCPTGDVCCGTIGMTADGGFGINVSCTATCAGRELCTTTADCPKGEVCRRGPGGFRECRPAFDGGPMDGGPGPDGGPTDGGAMEAGD